MMKSLLKPKAHLLKPIKDDFDKSLKKNILLLGNQNKLRDACEYALLNGGKRVRPIIVTLMAQSLGNGLEVGESALSVEYFHTASLIADDLPCMDNDDYRRSKPALHKVFGETVALLSSYGLITAGYEKIFQSVQTLSKEREPFSQRANECCVIALDAATRCAGISGAVGGQFHDLFPQEQTLEAILDVIYKKTVTLFEIAFIFGWIFGGGDLEKIENVRDVAYHFGVAFQVADDLGDLREDEELSVNIAHFLGKKQAIEKVEEELGLFEMRMKKLGTMSPEFEQLVDLVRDHALEG